MANTLNFQNLSTVQDSKQPRPYTIASAATIAPTTRMTFVSGTVQIATITPPIDGYHELILVFTNAAPGVCLTSGNIMTACAPVQNVPVNFYYDPNQRKYYAGRVAT